MAQLVRAPPCHGGGRGFEPHPGRLSKERELPLIRKRMVKPFFYMLICWYGGIGRRNRLKICRTFVRAGSSPATSIVMNWNPQIQLIAVVGSFSLSKIPIIALAEETFLLKSMCV